MAEEIEQRTGLRVQIIGGTLVMSPPPRGKHAGTVRRLRVQLDPRLPADLAAYEVSSIHMPDDDEDYATPDLVVLPIAWDDDDEWLADPHDVELAVEVISTSERVSHIAAKTSWYAIAGVPVLLAVDPRAGSWTLHTHARDGEYQGVLRGKYGEPVPLPAPLSMELDTAGLPLYTPKRRALPSGRRVAVPVDADLGEPAAVGVVGSGRGRRAGNVLDGAEAVLLGSRAGPGVGFDDADVHGRLVARVEDGQFGFGQAPQGDAASAGGAGPFVGTRGQAGDELHLVDHAHGRTPCRRGCPGS
ncbi:MULTISPECIES: Uma2 family endonuclease [unclassified Kitasatospora]|uniref:Uma2 family endonuclease n=1 Tax=unclassified Kitasatospora TaxID=2633591 RepID=UPI0033D3D0EA